MKTAFKQAQEQKIKKVAETIVKYQKFKNSIIIDKIGDGLAKSTKANYITCARHFLVTGEKYKNIVGNNFYKYLQECINKCVQPLTPSFDEKLRETKRKYTSKNVNPPITKILPKKITSKIEYGIKFEDRIVLEVSEDRAKAFLKGIKFLNNNYNAKLVTVELTEIE